MTRITLIIYLLFLMVGLYDNPLNAQSLVEIPGTHLKMELPSDFEMIEDSPNMWNSKYAMSFIELSALNYMEEVHNFKNVKEEYAKSGITITKVKEGKIGEFGAHFLVIEDPTPTCQIYFGNHEFCVMATVAALNPNQSINTTEISELLNSIEYHKQSNATWIEKANFVHSPEQSDFIFSSHSNNLFGFENKVSKDYLTINQYQPASLGNKTYKSYAKELIKLCHVELPHAKIMEESNWSINTVLGYRVLLESKKQNVNEDGLIYIFVFGNEKSTFIFKGFGKNYEDLTIERFDAFLGELTLK